MDEATRTALLSSARPVPIDGGYRIKEANGYYIDVMRMGFNWRLVTTPVNLPVVYHRFWCYAGTGIASFTAAALAATLWDGSDDTEPGGWNKNGQTGEWREPPANPEANPEAPGG